METLSVETKLSVLMKLLEIQIDGLERKATIERNLFQWTTSLLLAVFGVVVALADKTAALPHALPIKILSTIVVSAPALLSVVWIFRRSRGSVSNTAAIEQIQDLLGVFDDKRYGAHSPYPRRWEGTLASSHAKRKTPYYYTAVIMIMAACVILAIWFVL